MIRLALLICDDLIPPLKAIHGDYTPVFHTLLSASLARTTSDVTFTLDGYDVVQDMAYPLDSVHYDGLLISGSRASAYEDVEWINTLVAYVKRILTEKLAMKLFGICFGHQIIARALGGSCVRNHTWEVAVTTMQLTPLGNAIFGSDTLDLQQSHIDHVPTLPPNAHLLGSTEVTPNHGMVLFDPASAPLPADLASGGVPLTSIHVLTVQGHPEFTASIMTASFERRVSMGVFDEALVKDARARLGGIPERRHHHPDGLPCDGIGKVGKVIWGVLGVV